MLFDLGTLALTYSSIATEKSNVPFSREGGLFNSSVAKTVASSMANPAPTDLLVVIRQLYRIVGKGQEGNGRESYLGH
jgi:hypothetical protein